jgi:indolepyruvate ferredoxin oxidoreductase alpha subunit
LSGQAVFYLARIRAKAFSERKKRASGARDLRAAAHEKSRAKTKTGAVIMNKGLDGRRLLMGNEAIALGALRAGIRVAAGYPGTPSTEILESVARENDGYVHVEWSVNEKAAMEVAAGAAYCGARALVTMKQVGLNVASDALMNLVYVGVKGGLVVVVADDPGPVSSQTEQDTRQFALFAKLPVFDASSPEEAYLMVADAFAFSEKYELPVILRSTTRVCHGYASIDLLPPLAVRAPEGFSRDSGRWVIFPKLSYQNHLKIEKSLPEIARAFSALPYNAVSGSPTAKKGIATGGISYQYAMESIDPDEARLLKISTPHPFPEPLALDFLRGLDEVLVVEELDPVIERALIHIVGKHHLPTVVCGKLSGDAAQAGENSVESVGDCIDRFLGKPPAEPELPSDCPPLPARPPVLCAGCPHRASFYAVKKAARGRKAIFTGDIGCYTLGNAAPLDMVDTCLCMGAGITIAQGIGRMEPDALMFAFIGDSTFFASGITGIINAVYNKSDMILIVLDNATTAMTGQQPHPGTGKTLMGASAKPVSIAKILKAVGVHSVERANPFDQAAAVSAVRRAMESSGVRAILFEAPCIALVRPAARFAVDAEKCTGCRVCIRQIGCPAIVLDGDKVRIERPLCTGCSLCAQVCPHGAFGKEDDHA